MKESVFDVLIYLFENYINDDAEVTEFNQDRETLRYELMEAGFHKSSISKAFDWLEDLTAIQNNPVQPLHVEGHSVRMYTEEEMEKLSTECRGFLLFLEQTGALDHTTREMVIDRIMALEDVTVDLDQLKWVTLMVMFNQPGHEAAFAWMEDLVLDETTGVLH